MAPPDELDTLLAQHFRREAAAQKEDDRASGERALAALGRSLPPQRQPWRLWPTALLDWDFAPAWPRVAALAACAVLGFVVGVVGPTVNSNAIIDGSESISIAMLRNDLGSAISEPEPMTGVLP